ncbi:CBS domain-containing protein [Tardiphaga sp. OK245]|uniref:CBS domain-containing protein n=1 Tax=Tardiphaga sp. OK245 TaxID=1855306 RepID=UPI0008A7BC37|nr:CBS domain-containing protein [Tardiphaga sp. OK245]SEI19557.1 CBS domain-containing protein [Tardiphaga sp. OK245]
MNVADIMRSSFAVIAPTKPVLEAANILLETNQRIIPVVDSDRAVIGVVSEGDFLHRAELDVLPPPGNWVERVHGFEEDTPATRRMTARTVGEIMSKVPVCIDANATVVDVVALMDRHHIAQVPVMCGSSVVGLIGRTELLAAFIHAANAADVRDS